MKTCGSCKKTLPLLSFHKHKGTPDGKRKNCKTCCNVHFREYYAANREKHMQLCMDWQRRNPDKVLEFSRRTHEKAKKSSRAKLKYAIKINKIERGTECQMCGEKDSIIHAHHKNYSKAFEVTWLCTTCHGKIHRKSEKDCYVLS